MSMNIHHSLVQALRGVPDFADLDDQTVLEIVGESMNLFWKAGSTIFKAGDAGDAFYVVLAGECSIQDTQDPPVEVAHPAAGDSFGEMSLLLETTHSRTAVAVTDCEILVIPKESFTKLLESRPALAEHFSHVMEARTQPAQAG